MYDDRKFKLKMYSNNLTDKRYMVPFVYLIVYLYHVHMSVNVYCTNTLGGFLKA